MTVKEIGLTYRDTGIPFTKRKLQAPKDIVKYMQGAFDDRPEQESFWVILLNNAMKPLGRYCVTIGLANATLAHPREVFRAAIIEAATNIVVVHNHPSGDPKPSSLDKKMTKQLKAASKIIDITLLDHIIIGNKKEDPANQGYFSFSNSGEEAFHG